MPLLLVDVLEDAADLEQLGDGRSLSRGEVRQVRGEPRTRGPIENGLHLRRRPGGSRRGRLRGERRERRKRRERRDAETVDEERSCHKCDRNGRRQSYFGVSKVEDVSTLYLRYAENSDVPVRRSMTSSPTRALPE